RLAGATAVAERERCRIRARRPRRDDLDDGLVVALVDLADAEVRRRGGRVGRGDVALRCGRSGGVAGGGGVAADADAGTGESGGGDEDRCPLSNHPSLPSCWVRETSQPRELRQP